MHRRTFVTAEGQAVKRLSPLPDAMPRANSRSPSVYAMANHEDDDRNTIVLTKPKTKAKRPSMYKVIILNDDFTPMEFVVHVLERVFHLTHEKAFEIMLTVHMKGAAVVGVFTFEVAETKVSAVMEIARRNEHPLQCRMEKD
jgi:ATP-dependent Clp protease adaptor protein ClpS